MKLTHWASTRVLVRAAGYRPFRISWPEEAYPPDSGRSISSGSIDCVWRAGVAVDDVAVGFWPATCGEREDRFERDVPVKAAIVAKYEFLEVGVDMFAAQAMIRPQRPALQQREGAVAPGQDDVGRHVSDNARIVPVIAREPRIGGVAVGDQRRAGPHVGAHESLDRFGRVVGDRGQAQPTRTGVEILRALAPRLGPAGAAIDHFDRAGDQDFTAAAGLEECVADSEGNLRLVHLDDAFEKLAVGIDH